MDVLGLPLVLGLVVTGGIADRDDGEGLDVLGKSESGLHRRLAVRKGIASGPYGAESEDVKSVVLSSI